jgi:hypothetical protein
VDRSGILQNSQHCRNPAEFHHWQFSNRRSPDKQIVLECRTILPAAVSGRPSRQNWLGIVEITPNTGKEGKRLVSELGWRYDPRFDFSGPEYARSTVFLRLPALISLKLFLVNDLSASCGVPFARIQCCFYALFP